MTNSDTPVVNPELEAVKKEAEELKRRNEEAQKRLTEISTENATLRKRQEDLGQVEVEKKHQAEVAQISAEAQEIVNDLAGDPAKAAQKLAALMNRTKSEAARNAVNEFLPKVESFINKRDYMNDMRGKHPEYKEHEKLMVPMIESKIKSGMTLEKAIEETMETFKPFVESTKRNQSAPAGASGYTGANPIPAQRQASAESEYVNRDFGEHSRIETTNEIAERKAWQRGKHITKR
jgi:hypothetical protein